MEQVVSANQPPWQNQFVERVIGSIRRECTDHVVALDEGCRRTVLREYPGYYNRCRGASRALRLRGQFLCSSDQGVMRGVSGS